MTREKTGKSGRSYLIIEPEKDQTCELCGTVSETRPYGPGGKQVCFPCGMAPDTGTWWPSIWGSDWCGEFKEREEQQKPPAC